MNAIEKIVGEAEDQIFAHEWPSKDELKDFVLPENLALRGSVRLAAGLITDRKEVDQEWRRVTKALLEYL